MNKVNRLLAMLDAVFGFENKVRSNFKKIRPRLSGCLTHPLPAVF